MCSDVFRLNVVERCQVRDWALCSRFTWALFPPQALTHVTSSKAIVSVVCVCLWAHVLRAGAGLEQLSSIERKIFQVTRLLAEIENKKSEQCQRLYWSEHLAEDTFPASLKEQFNIYGKDSFALDPLWFSKSVCQIVLKMLWWTLHHDTIDKGCLYIRYWSFLELKITWNFDKRNSWALFSHGPCS